jgi:DNA-binding transcriptional ArsR family regulator
LNNILIALAAPTRRRVVDLLRKRPRPAGELSRGLKMSAPAMSRHLRVLRKAGLVEEEGVEHDARLRIYRLRREAFAELQSWVSEIEAFWTDQLGAFKTHAERSRKDKNK